MTARYTEKQPTTKNCFVCGRENAFGLHMTFYDNGVDQVESILTLDSRFEGYPGIIHGGILATILDEVVGRVSMIGDHDHFMMTVNMTVKYRNPVPVGAEIRAVGKAVRMRGRIGQATGQIILPDGTVACDAELTLADMPAEIRSEDRVDALGWQVVPD